MPNAGIIPFNGTATAVALDTNDESKVPYVKDSFWFQPDQIDSSRWSQFWPYQLMILSVTNGFGLDLTSGNASQIADYSVEATFTLPISPQELMVDMPFASTVHATLNGIVEYHGGAPFRDIMLTGTTGIAPLKSPPTAISSPSLSFANQILGGTFTALQGTQQALTNLISANPIPPKSTGYYQFRLLQKFLEHYIETKKIGISTNSAGQSTNKDLRLALAIWKDESIYLLTGTKFTMRKNASNPMEYNYIFQSRAWRRLDPRALGINLNQNIDINLPARAPNLYAQLNERFNAAIGVLNGTNEVIQALVQDPQNDLNNITRQVGLFLKTLSGTVSAVADFPDSIVTQLIPSITANWRTIRSSFSDFPSFPPSLLVHGASGISGTKNVTQTISQSVQNINKASGVPQQTQTSNLTQSQVNNILRKISPNQLQLPPQIVKALNSEKDTVLAFTRQDFENKFNQVKILMLNLADTIGLGDSTYNTIYSRIGLPQLRIPSDNEFDALYSLNEICLILESLAASRTIDPPAPTSLEYVAGLAQASGIAFTVPTSKFAVPFPYGFTLEELALKYLNDPNRWHEIATLNGLRQPYIDELGFKLLFLVNGNGSGFAVNDITNLYIGQPIYLSSNVISRNSRRILNIETIYTGFYQITVNGANDLGTYTLNDLALMEAYLPGTVNSQQLIYVPSPGPANPDLQTISIPGVDVFDPLLDVGGTDLLLNSDGDIVLTSDGSALIAYGLQNIIQNIKLALNTPKGSLLQHPNYGIDLQIGQSLADLNASDIAKSIQNMFSNNDAIASVNGVQVSVKAPGLSVTMNLKLKSTNQNVNVNFQVLR